MSKELNTVLDRIERQLNNKKSLTEREVFNRLSSSLSSPLNLEFQNKEDEKENQQQEPNNNNSTQNIPSYFNTSLFLSTLQPKTTNELEIRKLIERELNPYITSIKKDLEITRNKIRQELNEQTNIISNLKDIKNISYNNQQNITKLEKDISLIKNNKDNNYNNEYNEKRNVDEDVNFLKSQIEELYKCFNDVKHKNELLSKEIQLKDNIIKESEDKFYLELNVLKNQIEGNKKIVNNEYDNNNDNLREEFRKEINKIKNEIGLLKNENQPNYLNNNINNESIKEMQTKISNFENKIMNYENSQNKQYNIFKNEVHDINNQNIQLKSKINELSKELSNQIIKIQKLEIKQNEPDELPELKEVKISAEDLLKLKNEMNTKFNNYSLSFNKSINDLKLFKDNQEKYNDNINSELANMLQLVKKYNNDFLSLQNEIERYENNFSDIQNGFDSLTETINKVKQIENKSNQLEEGMRVILDNFEMLREKTDEKNEELIEWQKSLIDNISQNMNDLKNYVDSKYQNSNIKYK